MTSVSTARRPRVPSVETLIVATYGLFGLRLGAKAISDNSALLHIRTGMDMVRDGLVPAIPRVDEYSFTARGEPWVVQSWLPSTVVGWVERAAGAEGIVVLAGLTMAGLALLTVSLARTGDVRRTMLTGAAVMAVSSPFWTPRPLLVGLLCLALVIWVVERGHAEKWLLPIAWIWVNSHGSFALGLAWLLLRAIGDAIDNRERPRLGAVGFFAGGLALAAFNPLGIKLLTFPLTVGEKSEIFRTVIEWRTVDFQKADGLVALVGIVVAVALMARRPLAWRHVLPVAGFLGLGLLAQRNLAPLGIVLAPALAASMRAPQLSPAPLASRPPVATASSEPSVPSAPGVPSPAGASLAPGTPLALHVEVPARPRSEPQARPPSAAPAILAAALGGLALLFLGVAATSAPYDLRDYPVAAVRWIEERGRFAEPHRVVARDTVGNYIEFVRGPRGNVFIDDRVDMYPLEVSRDYADILRAGRPAEAALDEWKVDTVLWDAQHPLVDRLLDSGHWATFHRSNGYVVLLRTP